MKMQKTDMSIEDRRMWFNAMARKFTNKMFVATLPPGALEKYQAASNGSKEKFEMLKQFICDESLQLVRTNWALPLFPFREWLNTIRCIYSQTTSRQNMEVEACFVKFRA